MKQCISRIKSFLIHLWRTLKKYVCKIFHRNDHSSIYLEDVDQDGIVELVLDPNGKLDSSNCDSDSSVEDSEKR